MESDTCNLLDISEESMEQFKKTMKGDNSLIFNAFKDFSDKDNPNILVKYGRLVDSSPGQDKDDKQKHAVETSYPIYA